MADSAARRVQAVGNQLAATAAGGVPAITQVASASNGPRALGKVIIITGMSPLSGESTTYRAAQPFGANLTKAQIPCWV